MMAKKISHSVRQIRILQHCLSFLMIVLTCSGCAVNRDSADKVVAEQSEGTRYSKNTLMVFYDTHIGKEPLLNAFKKMNCEVLHEYRLSCGFAIKIPDGKSLRKTAKRLSKVHGVTYVTRDQIQKLQ